MEAVTSHMDYVGYIKFCMDAYVNWTNTLKGQGQGKPQGQGQGDEGQVQVEGHSDIIKAGLHRKLKSWRNNYIQEIQADDSISIRMFRCPHSSDTFNFDISRGEDTVHECTKDFYP